VGWGAHRVRVRAAAEEIGIIQVVGQPLIVMHSGYLMHRFIHRVRSLRPTCAVRDLHQISSSAPASTPAASESRPVPLRLPGAAQ